MSETTKHKLSIMTQIAILLLGFYAMADMFIVSPLLGEIQMAFPDTSPTTVQMCYAVSQITILISTLLCIPLVRKTSKKTLLVIGALLVGLGGGFGASVDNIGYMLVMRCIEGIGCGFIITLIPVVIAELYNEYKTQQLIGWQAAAGCGFGSLLAILSGSWAVVYGWQTGYWLYFISIALMVLIIAFIPKTPVDKPIPKEEQVLPPRINKDVGVWSIVVLVFALLTNCIFIFEATFMMETGIGMTPEGVDASAALAGSTQAVLTAGSAVGGILMAIFSKKFRSFLEFFCWAMVAIGSTLLFFAINGGNVPLSYIACAIFGLGYGTFFPWFYAKTTMICNPGAETKSMSLINCAYFIGMFVAVYFYLALQTLANNSTSAFCFNFMMIACVIVAVIFLITGIIGRKKFKELQ